ncbi:hypothetical protein CE91St24_14630 [Odoribacteraceae bacterium]|nr:hypothetical protein CE91St21_29640 [Odoribacteraceae bacterium]GKH94394.1 hypothetical protein CE91St23_28900 [Odoribacteraceae bacterium]GKH98722.1 hypothetical protein CE91St22_26000 [Odoribacteraceae bacterium]GKI02188.1 hypothetical protein CE91St24_14630 [Odoribacteraceae bacterium]
MFNFKIQIYEKKQEVFCFWGPLYPWKNKIAMEARLPDVRGFADVALCWSSPATKSDCSGE